MFKRTMLLLLLAAAAFGQTFRGAIAGSVTDATGAALGGANVKAVNNDTGLAREVTATGNGEFTLQDLPLGKYSVSVSHPGFQTVRVDNVAVQV